MRFPESAPVTEKKRNQLKERIERLGIDLEKIEEQAVKGSGPGGSKVNKSSNGVLLKDTTRGMVVRSHKERGRAMNRYFALRELVDQIEAKESPETSKRLKKQEKVKKQKARRKRRTTQKKSDSKGTV